MFTLRGSLGTTLILGLAGVLAASGAAFASPANAGGLDAASAATVVQQAETLGMSDSETEVALAKLADGQLPDALRQDRDPVHIEKSQNGLTITETSVFGDGSRSAVRYPDLDGIAKATVAPPGTVSPMADGTIKNCVYKYSSSAATWTNCVVEGVDLYVNMAYRLNATQVRGFSKKLTKVYDHQATAKLGNYSHVSFGLESQSAASYRITYTSSGGLFSFSRNLATTLTSSGAFKVQLY